MKKKTLKPKIVKKGETPLIKAVAAYSPKVIQERTIQMDGLVELISGRSSLNEGTVINVLKELTTIMAYYFEHGHAVKIDSLGTFTPNVALDGTFNIKHLPDKSLKDLINGPNWYRGNMKNKNMIGKSVDDLVTRWNEEHPDDKI
jgi:predicted histone-like DNA-binding protein